MNKKQQDKLWNELSEESKNEILKEYNVIDLSYCSTNKMMIERLFGKHNLNPKPQIKTWEDFTKEFHKESDWNPKNEWDDLLLYGIDNKIKNKIIATYKIAKLIELGYGGMVTKKEMRDTSKEIYNIYPNEKGEFIIGCLDTRLYDFICFHTYEQAKEFSSYYSNRKLIELYYMM